MEVFGSHSVINGNRIYYLLPGRKKVNLLSLSLSLFLLFIPEYSQPEIVIHNKPFWGNESSVWEIGKPKKGSENKGSEDDKKRIGMGKEWEEMTARHLNDNRVLLYGSRIKMVGKKYD